MGTDPRRTWSPVVAPEDEGLAQSRVSVSRLNQRSPRLKSTPLSTRSTVDPIKNHRPLIRV